MMIIVTSTNSSTDVCEPREPKTQREKTFFIFTSQTSDGVYSVDLWLKRKQYGNITKNMIVKKRLVTDGDTDDYNWQVWWPENVSKFERPVFSQSTVRIS